MFGETVVFLRPGLDAEARFVRKQAGQLVSKSRFVAAQVVALLTDDLWLRNAAHANELALRLAEATTGIPGVRVERPPVVNSVFARIPAPAVVPLQEWSFFWEWEPGTGLVRWMTGFDTSTTDVDRFVAGVRTLVAQHL